MIVDKTNIIMLQRGIWGQQQSHIAVDLVDVIDDGIYDPVKDVLHQIENTIEEELSNV